MSTLMIEQRRMSVEGNWKSCVGGSCNPAYLKFDASTLVHHICCVFCNFENTNWINFVPHLSFRKQTPLPGVTIPVVARVSLPLEGSLLNTNPSALPLHTLSPGFHMILCKLSCLFWLIFGWSYQLTPLVSKWVSNEEFLEGREKEAYALGSGKLTTRC